MQARIKQDARYGALNFFSGVEFVKSEWRTVPAGCEKQATENDYLETRAGEPYNVVEIVPPQATEPDVVAEVVEVPSPVEIAQTVNTAQASVFPKSTGNGSGRSRRGGK